MVQGKLTLAYLLGMVKSSPNSNRITLRSNGSICALYSLYNNCLIYNLPLARTLPPSSTT